MSSYWFITYKFDGGSVSGHATIGVTESIFNLESTANILKKSVPTDKEVIITFFKEVSKEQFEILNRKEE